MFLKMMIVNLLWNYTDQMAVKPELKNNDALTLYADAQVGQLYLKLISLRSTEAKVSVINLEGDTMLERNIPTNQLTFIPLSNISEGIYIAKVECENLVLSEKFKL